MYRVGIVTISDKGSVGLREDVSGPTIKKIVEEFGYTVTEMTLIPDEPEQISEVLRTWSDENKADLILTTGGTGFSMRDQTPEATLAIAERVVPGIAEAIRAYSMTITKRAMLSRGVACLRKKTLIVNMPGSPKAVKEILDYCLDTWTHGLGVLIGSETDCARK